MKLTFGVSCGISDELLNDDGCFPENHAFDCRATVYLNKIKVGELKGRMINSSIVSKNNLVWLFDVTQSALDRYYEFDKAKKLKLIQENNVLLLEEMEIDPKFRGKGLGIKLIKKLIKKAMRYQMDENFIVAMYPYPMKWETEEERDKGKVKLLNYYKAHLPKLKPLGKDGYQWFIEQEEFY